MAKYITVLVSLLCSTTDILVSASSVDGNAGQNSLIGFVGTRGKRNLLNDENVRNSFNSRAITIQPNFSAVSIENSNVLDDENHKKNLITDDLDSGNFPIFSVFKRAPNGFMGMRGKKDYDFHDNDLNSWSDSRTKKLFLQGLNRGDLHNRPIPKRAPSGFMGMRGKKASGFYGVRGKKYLEPNLYDQVDSLLDESEFYDDYHPAQLYDQNDWNDFNDGEKQHLVLFDGARGKRYPYDLDFADKRAPSGFVGMRGRRFYDDVGGQNDGIYEKRKPSGFLGVRGKKDVSKQLNELFGETQSENSFEKRSLAQFFGIRGKKQQRTSGYFGTRGKKQPFEFNGKFVGVRGKKDDHDIFNSLENELKDNSFNNKRTPSGFIGMRGKKDSNTNEK